MSKRQSAAQPRAGVPSATVEAGAGAEKDLDEVLKDAASGQPSTPKTEPEPKAKSRAAAAADAKVAPVLAWNAPLKDILHITRTMTEMGYPWNSGGPVSAPTADDAIAELMATGWQPIHLQSLGIQPDGIAMLWVLGMPQTPPANPFTEIHHVVRTVGTMMDRGVTGFQADALVASYLASGWSLAYVTALGMGPTGINMMWVLVR